MTRSVLWDSSAILALLDADDADHARAVTVAREIASEARPSFITNYIEAEAHALLVRKLGRTIARQWLLTGGLPVVRVLPAEEQKAREILARH
ncbi:MAG: VapC toxin family PIN domain ribonuclease, partial [Acidobacteria bacterium]